MSKGFASNYRIVLLATALLLSFGGLGVRLWHLHVTDRDQLLKSITKVRRQITPLQARRGDILDAKGAKLATSRPQVRVWVDPSVLVPEDELKWPQLAALLGRPIAEIESILRRRTRPIPLPDALPAVPASGAPAPVAAGGFRPLAPFAVIESAPAVAAATVPARTIPAARPDEALEADPANPTVAVIKYAKLAEDVDESVYARIQELKIRGVGGDHVYRRYYPQNQLASHLVGFVNREGVPGAGLESHGDGYLRGHDGWRESERDGRGREIAQFRKREVAPSDGYTLVLSIDSQVQYMVEAELERIVREFRPAGATIIVSDARTGFLLGLGNVPTFNLNEYNTAAERSMAALKNIAISSQVEPGSTFKIVAAAGALNEGLVSSATTFDCSLATIEHLGRTRRFMTDDHAWTHRLSVSEIISHSSNVGAAQLGMRLGERRLYDYAKAFGFGERAGFPLQGEISGVLNPPEKWSDAEITRIPAGYSVAATPLQIHYAMGAIASGGMLLQPQLIREIRDASGETVSHFDTIAKRRVVSEQTAATMAQMLMGVVGPDGTAANAAIPGYQVAGKTGTAQKLINGQYSKKNHIASFVGFFPASRPEIVITVIVDDGHPANGSAAYGRVVAAPAFRNLAVQLINYLQIKEPAPVPAAGRMLARQEGRR